MPRVPDGPRARIPPACKPHRPYPPVISAVSSRRSGLPCTSLARLARLAEFRFAHYRVFGYLVVSAHAGRQARPPERAPELLRGSF